MACSTCTEAVRYTPDPPRTGSLWLVGGRIGTGARTAVRADLEIRDGHIRSLVVCPEEKARRHTATAGATVDLEGYLILPGLINAHDHLEFNLFPRLGHGPYSNYKEWAADICRPDQSPVSEHLAVPKIIRLWWGGVKNLLAGVTTVCHHNPYAEVFESQFPVRVVKQFTWAHSLAFGKNIKAPSPEHNEVPFIIHLGEGTDAQSANEIFALNEMGALDSRTVIVHGVGLENAGLPMLERYGAALVWCPTSNVFTLGRTLKPETVANCARIALGSDSALTAQGDLLDEIRFAHRPTGINPERVYSMVSDLSADVLRLRNGEGTLRVGARADLIAVKDVGGSPAETLVGASSKDIELVMKEGEPNLLSSDMSWKWPDAFRTGLEPVNVQGVRRAVRAPLPWLVSETRKHLGPQFCLAGKEIEL